MVQYLAQIISTIYIQFRQDWKLNVKARLFVMTLRDHYRDRAESSAMMSYGQSSSDDWAFEYISAKYLQPIMEAFDDDGSGYVTYQEVNEFVEAKPDHLNWRCVSFETFFNTH